MGKKIKPIFKNFEDEEQEFEREVSDADYEKAISICRSPSDAHGHSEQISFRANRLYLRLASELMTREPAFRTMSDFHRTAYRLGCGDILKAMKAGEKIGDEIDDVMLTLDKVNRESKTDDAYRQWEQLLRTLPQRLRVYRGDKKIYEKELQKYEEQIKTLKSPFWRERLLKKFRTIVKGESDDEDDVDDGDS